MINKVILIGNIGQDIDLRRTQSGTAVTTLSVATNRNWKDKGGEKQTETEWHRVQVWGQKAEFVSKYLKKGNRVYVEGRLKTSQWEDQNGGKRYTTEIICTDLQSLSPRQDNQQQNQQQSTGYQQPPPNTGDDQVPGDSAGSDFVPF